jgi:hypothetical protein
MAALQRGSEPSEAISLEKKRQGSRAWSPIAAKAMVERAPIPSAPARGRILIRPDAMPLI